MIQQVLNKYFLHDLTQAIREELAAPVDDRRSHDSTPLDDFAAHERAGLDHALELAGVELTGKPATHQDDRRGEMDLSVQDGNAYMARSPEVSNLQSATEYYFRNHRPQMVEEAEVDDRRGDDRSPAGAQLTIFPEYLSDRRLFGRFEQTDLRWIGSLFSEGLRKFRGRRPFVPRPARDKPIPLPEDKLRLIVVGDWGSGVPRARKIGALMRRELDAAKVTDWQKHVIHLGDVYYSGWKYEYQDRFLKFWPVKLEEKDTIGSFNLNGNHDMYSGGWDYFDFALKDERFAPWQGTSSLFSLANSKWQIFALDTSYKDAALAGDQSKWMLDARLPGRKSMLLSHHQFCSSYEKPAASVVKTMAPILKNFDVAAWLWGHEHRCMTFKDVAGIRYPACIGHGGVPVYQTHDKDGIIPSPGAWEYRDYVDGGIELWAKFGFVTLDFHGDRIEVTYINEDGQTDRIDTIV